MDDAGLVEDGEAPAERVLPLVVRVEKAEPPPRTDALEAAARAVLLMVTTAEPAWREAVDAWQGNRIRKVVRRARGAEWRRASQLPGLTVAHGHAAVRVYPPIPLDDWPRDLSRLQVSGTELADPSPPADPRPGLPLVLLAPDVTMTAGKAMAQAGHAAQLGLWSLGPDEAARWAATGFDLAVRTASESQWLAALRSGAPVVHDAGFTEVTPGSATATFVPPAVSLT
ncbi:peptidyl-tRNA hydrolase [Cryptosporangium sp. NPDC051539]|uniref:peptidyl-tRNA hydrolase n=1 Tax=Cryptosporangium sp. NPDC051539 TaxID=3363962 RepID=UPI00378BEAAF